MTLRLSTRRVRASSSRVMVVPQLHAGCPLPNDKRQPTPSVFAQSLSLKFIAPSRQRERLIGRGAPSALALPVGAYHPFCYPTNPPTRSSRIPMLPAVERVGSLVLQPRLRRARLHKCKQSHARRQSASC